MEWKESGCEGQRKRKNEMKDIMGVRIAVRTASISLKHILKAIQNILKTVLNGPILSAHGFKVVRNSIFQPSNV